uniref:F-box domain-containing protein n=1 Tax=Leersia perrieri TaxID=77586 RepID=A0A0D9VQX3_9ORYZ
MDVVHPPAQDHQDRFNQLPDDILMSILERVDMRTVLRTSVLSTRWKQLPLLLSHFNLDIDEFIPPDSSMSADEAMKSLIKLMSSLFGSPQSETTINRLSLNFFLFNDLETSLTHLLNISELVCSAVDSGKVKSVELEIRTEKRSELTAGDMRLRAKNLEIHLVCATLRDQSGFKLTDLLRGTSNVKDLVLDFQGEEARKVLQTALNKITTLFLHGIYVKFDLLWTLVLLGSAPSIKIFGVKVWNHACDEGTEKREFFSERNVLWDAAQLDGSVHYKHLEKLEFGGFNPIIKEHLDFVRAVVERAPKLKSVVLEDREPCGECEAMDNPFYPSTSMFPRSKDEKSAVMPRKTDFRTI